MDATNIEAIRRGIRPHSFVSTLNLMRGKRFNSAARGYHGDAAHWRNCEIALEQMCHGEMRWGVPLCIDAREI